MARRPHSAPRPPRGSRPPGRKGSRAARRALWRFGAIFAASAIGLFVVYQVTEITHQFNRLNEWNAILCGGLLRVAGIPALRSGTTLVLGNSGMDVISECSAVHIAILFTAGVLAFPTTWRARGRGLLVGLPVIFAINVLRITSLGFVIRYRAALLPLVHEYLWQVLFVLVVAGLYLLWIERMVPREGPRPAA